MVTIVKGKNMKNNYKLENDDHLYLYGFCRSNDYDEISYLRREIQHLGFTNIKTVTTFVSYETYDTLYDLGYRLNIGEEYEGDIIENVEGTKDGDIVYYTNKILNIDENLEEKKRLRSELNKIIHSYKVKLEKAIAERDKKKWYQFWR